ncbi:OmpA family protein [Anaplasma phagocytophilum]|uniref:OmpA family protein n=1 Tax=Anaplasma phagocytophilum str. ApNP TaxID=1359153 RepID=A0A0F3NIJ4_ANAPH|nr:ompA family protein [Anaplasma phagocytophilum str. ApNP]
MLRRSSFFCLLALLSVTSCGTLLPDSNVGVGRHDLGSHRSVAFAKKVEKVYFDIGKYDLKGPGKKVILELVEQLKQDDSMYLVVIGHADATGTEEYSLALGEKRANAVKQFIIGCDKSLAPRVTTQSRGKAEPEVLVYSTDAQEVEKANAQNRRAVIVVEFAHTPRSGVADMHAPVASSITSENSNASAEGEDMEASEFSSKIAK